MSLSTTINEMLTPNLLGGLAAKSGLPETTVRRGLDGAMASILDGLTGKARDPVAMDKVADLVAKAPDVDADRLLDDNAPLRRSGNALVGLVSPDSTSMVARLAKSLGVGAGAASGLLATAASLVIGAFRKLAPGGLTGSTLSRSLLGARPVPVRREIVEHKRRPWILLALIPIALLAFWMWRQGRMERTSVVTAPEVHAPAVQTPKAMPPAAELSFPAGSVEANFLAHVKAPTGPDESTWFELDTVEYDTAAATLRPEADAQVARVAQILQAYPSIKIKVGGHTDATGSRDDNLRLSHERAESVRQALTAKGIDASRIDATGYGEELKVVETEGSAQANRRAAIRVSAR